MKPVCCAKGLEMNLDKKRCLIFVSLDGNDDTEFTGCPLFVGVLMKVEAKCFAVCRHKVTNSEHLGSVRVDND